MAMQHPQFPLFLDSGAHGLYTEKVIKVKHQAGYNFFETDEFWQYVDEYAAFVKQHLDRLTVYANVDVIFNPQMTWKVQRYLEDEHGLKPLPVFHYGTPVKWLKKYMDNYDYIALGGLGQEVTLQEYINFGDNSFNLLCDNPKRIPKWKIHGFAMTSPRLMRRWPWYSVDSTTWLKLAAYGKVLVPKRRKGQWNFAEDPWVVDISAKSKKAEFAGTHINAFTPKEKEVIFEYFKEQGFVLGSSVIKKVDGKAVEEVEVDGVSNSYRIREELNINYFMQFADSLPKWPWAFEMREVNGFGL